MGLISIMLSVNNLDIFGLKKNFILTYPCVTVLNVPIFYLQKSTTSDAK